LFAGDEYKSNLILVQPLKPVLQYIISQDTEQVYTHRRDNAVDEVFKTPYQYWHEFSVRRRDQAEDPQQPGLVVALSKVD